MKARRPPVVLDFSKLLPGPYCTMLLADLGCRVIRVELPHWPDPAREMPPRIGGVGFCYWLVNRGKESLCLDFRKPAGLEALRKLVARADVVVEGFRPGLMDKLGLGAKELLRRHPKLVYCSITGYGSDGPWARKAGHDLNFQAVSGLLSLGDSNGEVSFPPVQLADLAAAHYASSSILAALLHRDASGRGRHVKVSMAESVFPWQVMSLGVRLAEGKDPDRRGYWWNGRDPFYRLYRTSDGRHLAVGALERNFAVDLLRQVGRQDLEEKIGGDLAARDSIGRELEALFGSKTQAEWLSLLQDKDVCVSPVHTLGEALGPQPWASAPMMTGPGGSLVRNPVSFGPGGGKPTPPPPLGRDNLQVLRYAGLSPAQIRRLRTDRIIPS